MDTPMTPVPIQPMRVDVDDAFANGGMRGILPPASGEPKEAVTTKTAEQLLHATTLFRKLAGEDLAKLARHARVATYQRGDVIFEEGADSDFFCTIAQGRVKIYKSTPVGKDVILEIFGPGDPLGAVAAYEGRPFPASAAALEETVCVMIPRQAFFTELEAHPTLARGLLFGLTHRLIELTNRLAELSGTRVEPRVARAMLKLADQSGRPDRGGLFIPVALSRQDLADLAGTTIETCIRIMSRWGKQQIVRTEPDGFVVLNRGTLEELAEL
ncbi:MAG TPA: Crp/Fnr family transcriptional regulator [Vicinamibacterales bacterium]|jgi:CRP-like cAMP-binding protein